MSLKCVQVGDALFEELWSDELTGRVPFLTIGGEDAISKEGCPIFVECLSFACEEIYVSKPLKQHLLYNKSIFFSCTACKSNDSDVYLDNKHEK